MAGLKFEPRFTIGNILTLLGLALAGFGAYSTLVRAADNHETRLMTLEKQSDRNAAFEATVLDKLSAIQADVAVLKAKAR